MPKGGVGKTTNASLLSLLLAKAGKRVLTIDLDPEAGLSRDCLGETLGSVAHHLKSFLETQIPSPPPVIPTVVDNISLLPCPRGEFRFFRLFDERSTKLRDGLDLIDDQYDWIVMDLPNQLDNIAQLGMAAADFLVLPIELKADCLDRVEMAMEIIAEARRANPGLCILGAIALAEDRRLTPQEQVLKRQLETDLAKHGVTLFQTLMYSRPGSVALARSNFNEKLLHWTARRRFQSLLGQIIARITALSTFPLPHGPNHRSQPARAAASTAA